MNKRTYGFFLIICLLLVLFSGTAVAASQNNTVDSRNYYALIAEEYQNKPLAVDVQSIVTLPTGSVTIDINLEGFEPTAKTCKVTSKIELNISNRKTKTLDIVSYLEQGRNDLRIYHYMDGQWTKQNHKNQKILAVEPISAEDNLKLIKSVEIINDSPQSVDFKIKIDFDEFARIFEQSLLKEQLNFADQKEQDDFMDFCRKFIPHLDNLYLLERVDKVNKSLSMELDLTTIAREVTTALVVKDKSLKADDHKAIKDFLRASTIVFRGQVKILDKAVVVKVPAEAKKLAKEIKPAKTRK